PSTGGKQVSAFAAKLCICWAKAATRRGYFRLRGGVGAIRNQRSNRGMTIYLAANAAIFKKKI
ncbi:MAG: hypothetical protein PHW41_07190, partial [Eubacteriales bacterium]|nr:hypothetical protein [Eubacteriales bacterium]